MNGPDDAQSGPSGLDDIFREWDELSDEEGAEHESSESLRPEPTTEPQSGPAPDAGPSSGPEVGAGREFATGSESVIGPEDAWGDEHELPIVPITDAPAGEESELPADFHEQLTGRKRRRNGKRRRRRAKAAADEVIGALIDGPDESEPGVDEVQPDTGTDDEGDDDPLDFLRLDVPDDGSPEPEATFAGGDETRGQRQKRRRAERKADREALRDAKTSDRVLRRQAKKLKAPKEIKDPSKGKKTRRVKVAKKSEGKTKLSRADRKQRRIRRRAAERFAPPKGNKKATVLVVDGSHVTILVMRNGRVLGVTEQSYDNADIAVAAATKHRGNRLVWCNAAGMRSMPNRGRHADELANVPTFVANLREANALMAAFVHYPDQKLMTPLSMEPVPPPHRPNALSVPNEWAEHRLFQRHQGRAVTSGQCHGPDAGVWLRLGHYATELTHVLEGGYSLAWGPMPPLEFPPPVPGGERPDYGSGVDALTKACAAKSQEAGVDQYIKAVVEFVDGRMQQWGSTAGVIDVVWVHGPGVSTPGLLDALRHKLKVRVVRPPVDVAPSVLDVDQAVCALHAWSHKPLKDPRKIIAKARRGRQMQLLRRVFYAAMGVMLLVSLAAWQGRGRHLRLEAAQARIDQANSDLAAAQSAAPPDVAFGISGALEWLGCPLTAAEISAGTIGEGPSVVAAPFGYDPSQWPEGWDAVIDAAAVATDSAQALSRHVAVGRVALTQEIAGAQRVAASFRDGDIADESGDGLHDEIDAAFLAAGLDPGVWRVFAWAHLHFSGQQFYVPPRTTQMCASATPDLLWKAQNEPLLPVMFVRQMQTYPGWGITEPGRERATAVSLSQEHTAVSIDDFSVFTAWIVHRQEISEVLQPLLFHLWGEDGAVRIAEPLTRQCRTGLHPATGQPLDLCGSSTSVVMGPRHLVLSEDQEGAQ